MACVRYLRLVEDLTNRLFGNKIKFYFMDHDFFFRTKNRIGCCFFSCVIFWMNIKNKWWPIETHWLKLKKLIRDLLCNILSIQHKKEIPFFLEIWLPDFVFDFWDRINNAFVDNLDNFPKLFIRNSFTGKIKMSLNLI